MELKLNIAGLVEQIKKQKKVKKAILQVPDGLKTEAQNIIDKLTIATKIQFYLDIEPVYGACDLATNFSEAVNADLIIHLGHSKFCEASKKVIYWPTYYDMASKDLDVLVKNIDEKLKQKKIVFVGPIQYSKIIKELEKRVRLAKVIKTTKTGLLNENQILGCDTSILDDITDKVDAIVYIGDGNFHISALAQKVQIYQLEDLDIVPYDQKDEIRGKIMSEYIFKNAKNIGILVTSKVGQNNFLVAEKIYTKLKKLGKNPYLLIADFISYDKIMGLKLDCIVNTACPRIIDDKENYKMPLINYKDILKFI
ncbi:MAG: diphthamide biosynthesis enzyme Dph2 [Candidatus ainarchaeum sp.]|nr:diphthamide biosynthesis enzyme Dph2 [Candidatus ainarchaeum sp.]